MEVQRPTPLKLAVILPCYNEEQAIAKVVSDFNQVLPEASIYVFDNNSTDRTAQVAAQAGAKVVFVGLMGKGNVVRRMFADIEADIYLMADGDETYEASVAQKLIADRIRASYIWW
jgi:glycosyltransferase involved in cell wall biosynthesis